MRHREVRRTGHCPVVVLQCEPMIRRLRGNVAQSHAGLRTAGIHRQRLLERARGTGLIPGQASAVPEIDEHLGRGLTRRDHRVGPGSRVKASRIEMCVCLSHAGCTRLARLA